MRRFFQFIMLVVFALSLIVMTGCKRTDQQNRSNLVVDSLVYIQDQRTHLCFAYTWRGGHHGGPALACVPCDSIPPELLFVAEIKHE